MKHRISPATIIATMALFFSLGGAGMAATGYRITSLWQIAPNVRHALRGHDGARGPQGIQGPAGVAGTVDWSRVYLTWKTQTVSAANFTAQADTYCNGGDHALTGGFEAYAAIVTISEEMPAATAPDGTYHGYGSWTVVGHFDPTHQGNVAPDSGWVQAWALCARSG